jgi:TatD DNase family protein
MKWVDSHAHLADKAFAGDRDAVVQSAVQQGVAATITVCTDSKTLQIGREITEHHPSIYLAASTTPHEACDPDPFFEEVAQAATNGELVAVGETGLEYHHRCADHRIQRSLLQRYLSLAGQYDLPVILHCREAFADLFSVLDHNPSARGVFHCFTGTLEEAKGVIARDWYLSLSGIVTFKKSEELRRVAGWIPLERLLVETDSPYLAPQSHRGQRNEPALLIETGAVIAEQKRLDVAEIAKATSENARSLFKLP